MRLFVCVAGRPAHAPQGFDASACCAVLWCECGSFLWSVYRYVSGCLSACLSATHQNPITHPPTQPHTQSKRTAKIPGVNKDGAGFWSVTAYSLPDRKLVPNALGRYSVGGAAAISFSFACLFMSVRRCYFSNTQHSRHNLLGVSIYTGAVLLQAAQVRARRLPRYLHAGGRPRGREAGQLAPHARCVVFIS